MSVVADAILKEFPELNDAQREAIAKTTGPLLVVAGTKDEAMIYCQYEPVISQYTTVQVKLLQGISHMGLVACPEVRPVVKEWLEGLDKQ